MEPRGAAEEDERAAVAVGDPAWGWGEKMESTQWVHEPPSHPTTEETPSPPAQQGGGGMQRWV